MIDYQIQTTASDGKFSPRDCVKMAKDNGLISISITDHDTVAGVPEALRAGKEFGVEVIPGIELSTEHTGKMIHILGYGIDYTHPKLLEGTSQMEGDRETRARKIVEKLKELGFTIEYENVRKRAAGVVARPHIADEVLSIPANASLLAREGVATKQDFFDKFIGQNGRAAVEREEPSSHEAIELIHEVGGVAIWAHPTWPKYDFQFVEDTLVQFLAWGLDGIEALCLGSEDEVEFLQSLVQKYGIMHTAGSDFHDLYSDPERPEIGEIKIGECNPYGYSLEGIRESLLAAIEKRRALVR